MKRISPIELTIASMLLAKGKYGYEISMWSCQHKLILKIKSCILVITISTIFFSNGTGYIDNPDQRITADTNILCTIYGSIINNLIVAPPMTIYYAYDAYTRTGWIGPTAMFILFFFR